MLFLEAVTKTEGFSVSAMLVVEIESLRSFLKMFGREESFSNEIEICSLIYFTMR
jgi:hypothetical protein